MPAVDKLLLEEALQDSPQVPPAAPVPLARRGKAEEAPPAPGWRPRPRPGSCGSAPGPLAAPPPGFFRAKEGAGRALNPEPGQSWGTGRAPRGRCPGVVTRLQTQLQLRLRDLNFDSI